MSIDAKKLDELYWGAIHKAAGVPYTLDWVTKHFRFMDIYYNYLDSSINVVAQAMTGSQSIDSGASHSVSFTNAIVKVGDILTTEIGIYNDDLDVESVVTSDGSITTTIRNNGSDAVSFSNTYILVRRL